MSHFNDNVHDTTGLFTFPFLRFSKASASEFIENLSKDIYS